MAYDDVKVFLTGKGFEHEQGSGYHSIFPMLQSDAIDIVTEMLDIYPWLHKCVRICTIADVPVTYDLTPLFDKEVNIPARAVEEKQSVIKQIRDFQKSSREDKTVSERKHKRKQKNEQER